MAWVVLRFKAQSADLLFKESQYVGGINHYHKLQCLVESETGRVTAIVYAGPVYDPLSDFGGS